MMEKKHLNLRSMVWDPLWIFLLCAVCFCWALGNAPLAGTEGFRALTAHQMLDSGDWLIPRLYGQLYLRKPPMHYWILALAENVAGSANEWVWRMPSALGAALLGAFICRTAQRWWNRAAGLASGFAFLSLGALWSQFRSADIDALNTVFAFVAVVCIFEIYRRKSRSSKWILLGGLAFGASLLMKGPASLPLILGAIFGPPILNSNFKKLGMPALWGMIAIGAACFGVYFSLVYDALGSLENPAALSGLREAGDKMLISSWSSLGDALILPVELFALSLPASLTVAFLLRPTVLRSLEADDLWLLRGIVGTLVLAVVIGIATGMENTRYGYILLPLFALATGLVASALSAGKLSNRNIRLVNQTVLIFAVLLCIGVVAIAMHLNLTNLCIATVVIAVLAIVVAPLPIFAWLKKRPNLLYASLVVSVVLAAFAFDYLKNRDRLERSGRAAGIVLREIAGPDAKVVTGLMLWTHPEIFHYAGADVNAYNRYRFEEPFDLEARGWILFHRREWIKWFQRYPERFSRSVELPTHVKGAVLTWYTPPGESDDP